uniref:Uncharacterized protein LOC111112968 isoform X1 n=1 Tax=Crassostrea virginica TaxID=6565 RepID=A0A8B8BUK1_CRAVI|nr:uncharacterized protein LOC111112968 isoform X1 [Crassostrea virginica]
MATSKAETLDSAKEVKNVCPICFESFKTPRYLPCSHTFCHNCLSSYILSTCKSKENPVGFPCPLCRQFVPAPSFLGEPDKWTEFIPINTIVRAICEQNDKFCNECRRENEEEEATDWCNSCLESLCRTCVKSHKRNASSRNHELIPLSNKCTIPIENESRVLCKDHSVAVKYMCVDHEELCCAECVCTKHRTCNQVDEIEKTAENLIKAGTLEKLGQEILQCNGVLIQAKTEGEATMKYIDETSDKILKESSDVRDKLVRHINALVETHQDELAKKVKGQKESLVIFVDTVSDRQLLMAQLAQTLTDKENTPPSVLVHNYLKIKGQFKQITGLRFYKPSLKLHSYASKHLLTILDTLRLEDVRMENKSVPVWDIGLTCVIVKIICELPESGGGYITGGCFLENGDIVLANNDSKQCLYYNKSKLVRKIQLWGKPWDVICRKPPGLIISTNLSFKGYIEQIDVQELKNISTKCISDKFCDVYQLAISPEFVYAACSTFILKLDHKGNAVKKISVDEQTFSVAVNNQEEIISSSCKTEQVTVMNQSGTKLHSYSNENLKNPISLDVIFSGCIFVAGQKSNNIHVLTPTAELLRIFEFVSPRCIRLKENSYMCIVDSNKGPTKVCEFLPA